MLELVATVVGFAVSPTNGGAWTVEVADLAGRVWKHPHSFASLFKAHAFLGQVLAKGGHIKTQHWVEVGTLARTAPRSRKTAAKA